MDTYGTAGAAVQTLKSTPELGRLKSAAERIAVAREKIDRFVFNFHGPTPEGNSADARVSPPDSYRNDLDSLFAEIDRLETVASRLDTIG